MLYGKEREDALQDPAISAKLTPEQAKYIRDRKRKAAAIERANKALSEHDKACPHFLVFDSDYIEGTYYDRAYTKHYHLCLICGHRTEIERTTHNHFG